MAQTLPTFNLFKLTEPKGFNAIANSSRGSLAYFLSPNGNGNLDIVKDYTWTLTPKEGRKEVPWVWLKEYRLLDSSFINSARYYATGAAQQVTGQSSGSSKNQFLQFMPAYEGLFDFDHETGFTYTIPYFNETLNEVRSSWTSLDITEKIKGAVGKFSPGAAEAIGAAADAIGFAYETNYPRVGIMDRPKLWESSDPRSINIRFPLYNTRQYTDVQKNWELCYLLMYQNMFNKRDFITALPPVFYSVNIPGQYFTIAAYVSELKVYNRGNIRRMKVGNYMRNVPDAFEIDMTLTDMVMPSQNMQSAILFENPITVE